VGLEGTENLKVQRLQTVSAVMQEPDEHNFSLLVHREDFWAVVNRVIIHDQINLQRLIIETGSEKSVEGAIMC
jgi:hypothetical protein